MNDFHNRIMRIPSSEKAPLPVGLRFAYKQGHRDARHAAAEIAIEAEQIIEAQSRALKAAREALDYIGRSPTVVCNSCLSGATRNALAQIEAVKEKGHE